MALLGMTSNVDILRINDVFELSMLDGATLVAIATLTPGVRFKISYGRDAAGRSASLNGATAVTGSAPGAGHIGQNFQLGAANGGRQSRSIHHNNILYNVRKSDAELEALST